MNTTLKAISAIFATSAASATWLRGLCAPFYAALCTAIFISAMPACPAWAADSTSFNPLAVTVQAQAISGVPVGTIISWPVYNNPEGWAEGNWLECNGQYISPSAYPELCAVVGANVPDLRGLFLRGVGGQSAGLGTTQGDAIRNITGTLYNTLSAYDVFGDISGMVYGEIFPCYGYAADGVHRNIAYTMSLDASRVVPTAAENRPVNRAVRYLIRARP